MTIPTPDSLRTIQTTYTAFIENKNNIIQNTSTPQTKTDKLKAPGKSFIAKHIHTFSRIISSKSESSISQLSKSYKEYNEAIRKDPKAFIENLPENNTYSYSYSDVKLSSSTKKLLTFTAISMGKLDLLNSETMNKNFFIKPKSISLSAIDHYSTNCDIPKKDKADFFTNALKMEEFENDLIFHNRVFNFTLNNQNDDLCAKVCNGSQAITYMNKHKYFNDKTAAKFFLKITKERSDFPKHLTWVDKKNILYSAQKLEKLSDFKTVFKALYGEEQFNKLNETCNKNLKNIKITTNNASFVLGNDLWAKVKQNFTAGKDLFAD